MSCKLTSKDCDRILAAAEARAREIGVPMVIAIVDAGGNLKCYRRMEGSLLASIDIAQGKAYTACALRLPTRDVGRLAQPGQELYGIEATNKGRIVTFGGGFPLWRGDQLLGGIGVSGGSVDEDEDVARAGLAAL